MRKVVETKLKGAIRECSTKEFELYSESIWELW